MLDHKSCRNGLFFSSSLWREPLKERSLDAKHWSKHFTRISLFNHHNNLPTWRMENLPKETQEIRGGTRIKTDAIWLSHHHCLTVLSWYHAETASDLLILIISYVLSTPQSEDTSSTTSQVQLSLILVVRCPGKVCTLLECWLGGMWNSSLYSTYGKQSDFQGIKWKVATKNIFKVVSAVWCFIEVNSDKILINLI